MTPSLFFHLNGSSLTIFSERAGRCPVCRAMHFCFVNREGVTVCLYCAERKEREHVRISDLECGISRGPVSGSVPVSDPV